MSGITSASKLRFSKLDQENLLLKVEEWKKQFPDEEIFFRGYGEKDENELIVDNNGSDDDDAEDIKVCSSEACSYGGWGGRGSHFLFGGR